MNSLLHGNYYFLFGKGNKPIEKGIFKIQKSPSCKGFRALQVALLVSFLYAAMGGATAQTIHYVKVNGTGDGTSWANASGDLQATINSSVAGDQVWVAAGTYLPNRRADALTVITPNDRCNAFVLKSNVKMYGGFAGNETALTQRDSTRTINNTILSGDIGTVGDNSDNAYHVVISAGDVGTAELNGFTISGGNANGYSTISVNSNSIGPHGGGIINYSSSPVISNVTITRNATINYGGGIFNNASSSPVLTNVTISGNTAGYGGGIYNYNSSSPVLTNISITGNTAAYYGGGVINYSSSPVLTNVSITGNTASNGDGGGIFSVLSSLVLTNVTISGNTATATGGGIYNSYSSPVLTNVTISGNTAGYGVGIYNSHSSPKIRNTIIYGNNSGIYNDVSSIPIISYSLVQGSADVTNGNIDGSTDPKFVTPVAPGLSTGGNYRLQPTSPLINAGSNVYFDAGQTPDLSAIITDLDGKPRILDGVIDMGAYESGTPPAVAGTISGAGAVCSGTNSTTLTLSGYTGTIQWQSSADNVMFNNIDGATGATYSASNLTATTWYRAVVTSGGASATSPGVAVTVSALPSINITSSNPHLYFGAPGDQTSTITASATGGAAPYTITFSSSRALISNYINDAGDEIWKAPGSTTTSTNPPSVFTGIADGGLASINVALLADADITATVTDANGCTQIAGAVHVIGEDARCFAGKSKNAKVLMCHVTGSKKNPRVQICVDENAVQSHLEQGDFLGSCTVNTRDMNLNAVDAVKTASGLAQKGEVLGKLTVKVMPNPTSYYFTLELKSLSKERVKLTVTDITGRIIEERTNIPANSSIQLAGQYHPGVYIAELLQGSDKVTIRLIKEGK